MQWVFLDGGSVDEDPPHCCLSGFQPLFILVEHFHRVAPRSSAAVNLQNLQLWGSEATNITESVCLRFKFMLQTGRLLRIWENIVICTVWCSVMAQTSRAANMSIHVLLWTYVFANEWNPQKKMSQWTTRFYTNMDLKTGPLYIVSTKTSFTLLTY